MYKAEKKNENIRITPARYGYFREFENNPAQVPEKKMFTLRFPSGDFIVDWQMDNPKDPERRIS